MPNIKLNSEQITTTLFPLSHTAISFVKQGKFPVNIRENKFTMRVNTEAGAQGGCRFSTLEITQNPAGQDPEQPALPGPALWRGGMRDL